MEDHGNRTETFKRKTDFLAFVELLLNYNPMKEHSVKIEHAVLLKWDSFHIYLQKFRSIKISFEDINEMDGFAFSLRVYKQNS